VNQEADMSEANKALVRRWFEEVRNKGRVEAIEEMFAADGLAQRTLGRPECSCFATPTISQFDLTEINFNIDGYEYSVFDDYNGQEQRAIATQGVNVTPPGQAKKLVLFVALNQKPTTALCKTSFRASRNN
jgi:hypothetical protein